jgi:hypothetical protein
MLIVSLFLPTPIEFSFGIRVATTLGVSLGNRRLRRALYHGLRERVEKKNCPQINADTAKVQNRER